MKIVYECSYKHSLHLFQKIYPSVSEKLLDYAIPLVSSLGNMSKDESLIIKHAGKSFLFNNGKPWVSWVKKNSTNLKYDFMPWVAMTVLNFATL
jgi:hypothetical protein